MDAHLTELTTQGMVFGLANSLHCAGMCGPMAAFFLDAPRAAIPYHTARTLAYVGVGTLAGTAGLAVGAADWGHGGAVMALVLALALLAFALGLDRHLGRVPGAGRIVTATIQRTRSMSPYGRAAAIGLLTPLLPCGLLSAAGSAAGAAGGPAEGAASMFGFALGLLPVLVITQANLGFLQRALGPERVQLVARITMVLAALMLGGRAVASLTAAGPGDACPLCADS
ncbi:MAG: sulfite exporter TauE/SafE family protein [Planctomycetota bacterium]